MKPTYIWTLPTRVFHWLFVLLIIICYLTEDDELLLFHAISGYALVILLFFRFFWGFIGPQYSRFKDFPLGIQKTKQFMLNIFDNKQSYIGHNPPASLVMITILIVCFFIIVSGSLTYGAQEAKGIFSSLNQTIFKELELFEGLHELLANFLYVLIALHLGGILTDRLLHKKHQTLHSIINGYKVVENQKDISLNLFQKTFAFLMFIVFIIFVAYSFYDTTHFLLS